MIIGIDLGTTNSVAAYMTDDGPKLIPNALGDELTPSVVGFDQQGQVVVGRIAKELQVIHPQRCASAFKRYMGTDWTVELDAAPIEGGPIKDRPLDGGAKGSGWIGGKRSANCHKFTPEKLSSLVLRWLKQDAEAHLGCAVDRAVISVPAYFNDNQRKATIRAGKLAALTVERIVNEPTAAAIAYGLHDAGQNKVVAVFDLGGGTFDVSVVELFDGVVEVRATCGECFLGGEDFTRVMAARILQSCGHVFERLEAEHPRLVSRMIQQCERAKCALSRQESVVVAIPDRTGDVTEASPRVNVTRDEFRAWTDHILAQVDLPIRRSLGDANVKRSDVDEVILVGGATRMPAVVDRVTDMFQRAPRCRLDPDHVVALGAAVQAGLIARHQSLEDLVVTDVAPFTLGVEITKLLGLERRSGYFLPIINRNTTVPVSRVDRLTTVEANQTSIRIAVYQGENRRVKDNLPLGEFSVTDIPRGPVGQEIDVRFTYDLNGVLEVEVTVVETGKKVGIVITKHAAGMSEDQVARAVADMQALKTHPREETANRFLARRAERIYRELPLAERKWLEELLDGFEAALEMQDPEAIQRNGAALEEFLNRHEENVSDDSFGNPGEDDDDRQ
jgi:molecular chaperone HscC